MESEQVNQNNNLIDIDAYLQSLNEKEYKAYEIAKSHLGTSFDIKKSNGFLEWLKKHKTK